MNTKRKLKQAKKQAKRETALILPAEMFRWGLQNMTKDLAWFACDAREFAWKKMKLAAAQRRGNTYGRM